MGYGQRPGAQVAQLVEHATENRSVGGSIPPLGTMLPAGLAATAGCANNAAGAKPTLWRGVPDFWESLFTQKLYRSLALSFGHISHLERGCFYNHFFRDLLGKVAFLVETLAWIPCGQPSHTFCDVERAVLARLRQSNLLDAYRALRAAEVERAERALLAKLREKYEGTLALSQTSVPILHPGSPPKARRSAQQSGQTNHVLEQEL